MKEIIVIKNSLGCDVGAYAREDFREACDVIQDGDAITFFADGEKVETISGALFKKIYGAE